MAAQIEALYSSNELNEVPVPIHKPVKLSDINETIERHENSTSRATKSSAGPEKTLNATPSAETQLPVPSFYERIPSLIITQATPRASEDNSTDFHSTSEQSL